MGTHRNFQKMLQVKMFLHGLILSFLISRRMDIPADANAANHPPAADDWIQYYYPAEGPQNYGKGQPGCLGLVPHRINLIWINGSCTLHKSGMS
jgi:hypothetical protein